MKVSIKMVAVLVVAALAVGCGKDDNADEGYGKEISCMTDPDSALFFIANKDAGSGKLKWYPPACEAPYREPGKNELQLIWLYKDAFAGNGLKSSYWSATSHSMNDHAWYIDMSDGSLDIDEKTKTHYVRCILDNDSPAGVVYPYIDDSSSIDGLTIVSHDSNGGVMLSALTSSPGGMSDNTVAAKFIVANEDSGSTSGQTWSVASTLCPNDWRLPTQRELLLIWLMGGGQFSAYQDAAPLAIPPMNDSGAFSSFVPLNNSRYWSSTPGSESYIYWVTSFSSGAASIDSVIATLRVRCVKDVQ